jgi:hypothetical protein
VATTVSQLVTDITAEGAFDADPAQVLRWLDRRHKQMCARAGAFRKTASAGVTVAGQQSYAVPAGLLEALEVTVGGVTYTRGRHTDIASGDALVLGGTGGIFLDTADSAGVQQVALFPVPSDPGDAISVYGLYAAPDLATTPGAGVITSVLVDDDAVEGLLHGVFATALSRPGEARWDLAQAHEASFETACLEFKRRVTRRLRGSGPSQIRVIGYNA